MDSQGGKKGADVASQKTQELDAANTALPSITDIVSFLTEILQHLFCLFAELGQGAVPTKEVRAKREGGLNLEFNDSLSPCFSEKNQGHRS